MKRLIWQALIALFGIAVLALLAFGPRPLSSIPPGRVRITYWEKWNGQEAQQAQAIVDRFNNTVGAEKGIWVDYVSISGIQYKTLVSTAAGLPPDVAGLWDTQILEYADMGALDDLTSMAESHGLGRDYFKPVFYDGCVYKGKLYGLPSTVFSVALIYNKEIFQQKADKLRAAGLDPDRPPRTIAELDKYAQAIDTWETRNGTQHLAITGFIPQQPGSFTNEYPYWFGADFVDPTGTKMLIDTPQMFNCYEWIRSYGKRLGKESLAEFSSGFGQFDSPSNPFLVGQNAMEEEGPWMAAFIERLKPEFNRWNVPADQLQREKDFEQIIVKDADHPDAKPMTVQQVEAILGPGDAPSNSANPPPAPGDGKKMLHWLAGIKDLYVTFADDKAVAKQWKLLPGDQRKKYTKWAAAPMPSAVPGLDNVSYDGMDVLVVPRTSLHKKEAYDFIEFMERQENIEKLASDHCNLSPLAKHSDTYFRDHPNAYADVWEALATSPNARPLPKIPNWPQLFDELTVLADSSNLQVATTKELLQNAQIRIQKQLNVALDVPENTNLDASGGGSNP